MATFNKFNIFTGDLAIGAHNLESHTLKVALTNTAPDPANDAVWSAGAFPPPVAANGYTTGGNTLVTSAGGSTPGVYKLTLVDSVFTAQTGGIGPFRYAIIYNSSSANKLIGYYDYATSLTLTTAGDTFTVDFSATNGVLTIE